jgi:hypothetical protein
MWSISYVAIKRSLSKSAGGQHAESESDQVRDAYLVKAIAF